MYDDIKKDIDLFGMTNFSQNHKCFFTENKKKIGKFKCGDKITKEIVLKRSKTFLHIV